MQLSELLGLEVLDDTDARLGTVVDVRLTVTGDLDGIAVGDDIAPGTPAPRVSGILTGQVLATRIFGGQPPRTRMQPLPWRLVAKLGTVAQLRPTEQPIDGHWLDHWLRDHLIGRIPGGRHAAQ